jgi:hypothetical protein
MSNIGGFIGLLISALALMYLGDVQYIQLILHGQCEKFEVPREAKLSPGGVEIVVVEAEVDGLDGHVQTLFSPVPFVVGDVVPDVDKAIYGRKVVQFVTNAQFK